MTILGMCVDASDSRDVLKEGQIYILERPHFCGGIKMVIVQGAHRPWISEGERCSRCGAWPLAASWRIERFAQLNDPYGVTKDYGDYLPSSDLRVLETRAREQWKYPKRRKPQPHKESI